MTPIKTSRPFMSESDEAVTPNHGPLFAQSSYRVL